MKYTFYGFMKYSGVPEIFYNFLKYTIGLVIIIPASLGIILITFIMGIVDFGISLVESEWKFGDAIDVIKKLPDLWKPF